MSDEQTPDTTAAATPPAQAPGPPPVQPRRRRRWLWWLLAVVLGLPILVVLLVAGLLFTPPGHRAIEWAARTFTAGSDYAVELEGLNGRIPWTLGFDHLTVSDSQGVWAEVADFRLDVAVEELLDDIYHVRLLQAGLVRVERIPPGQPTPEPETPSTPEEPFQIPSLPHVRLDRLDIAELHLGQELIGEAMTFRVHAELEGEGDTATVSADVDRLDRTQNGAGDGLILRAERHDDSLQLDAEYHEAPGGLVGHLAGLPPETPFSLDLQGDGPLSSWQGNLEVQAGESIQVASELLLGVAEPPYTAELDGSVRLGESILPPDVELRLGRAYNYNVQAAFTPDELVQLDLLHLATPTVQVDANGRLELPNNAVNLTLRVDPTSANALLEGTDVRLENAKPVELFVTGTLDAPTAAVDLHTGGLSAPGAHLEKLDARLTAELAAAMGGGDTLPVRVDLTSDAVTLDGANLRGVNLTVNAEAGPLLTQEGQATVNVDGLITTLAVQGQPELGPVNLHLAAASDATFNDLTLSELLATAPGVRVAGTGAYSVEQGTAQADLQALVSDIAPYLPAGGPLSSGSVNLELTASGDPTKQIDIGVQGDLSELAGLPKDAATMLGKRVGLDGKAVYTPERITLNALRLKAAQLSATASGDYVLEGGRFDATLDAQVNSLAPLSATVGQDLAGKLDLKATATGTPEAFAATAAATSERIKAGDLELRKLALDVNAESLPDRPQGRLKLSAVSKGQPVAVNTQFDFDPTGGGGGGLLDLSSLSVEAPGVRADGQAQVALAEPAVDGRLDMVIKHLQMVQDLTGESVHGNGEVHVRMNHDSRAGGGQNAQVTARLRDLAYDVNSVESLDLDADATDLLGTPGGVVTLTLHNADAGGTTVEQVDLKAQGTMDQADVTVEASNVAAGNATLDSVRLTAQGGAQGETAQADITLTATGNAGEPLSLDTKAQVSRQANGGVQTLSVLLQELTASFAKHTATLEQPARLTMAGEELRLEELVIASDGAKLSLDASKTPQDVDAHMSLDNFSLALLQDFVELPIQGTASAKASLTGPVGSPQAKATLRLDQVTALGETAQAPKVNVVVDTQVTDHAQVDVSLSGLGREAVTVQANAPVQFSLEPMVFELPQDGALQGQAKGNLDLSLLNGLAALEGQAFQGQANLQATLAGTVAQPSVDGSLTLANGRYENVPQGVILADMNVRVEADAKEVRLVDFSATDGATDGAAGRIHAEGKVGLDPAAHFPFGAKVTVNRANLVRREDVKANASADLDISGDLVRSLLKGTVTLHEVNVQIPGKLPPSVVDVDVIEINVPGQDNEAALAEPAPAMVVDLDVKVDIPNQLWVRGRGLDAEFAGNLAITGTADDPILRGAINVVSGDFVFLDRDLNLDSGTIQFAGSKPPKPLVNLVASTNAGDITARLRITGSLPDFSLALESDPPLPNDEILARILFDRSVSELNPFQAAMLAQGIAELTGYSSGPGVIGRARQLLGVDRLEVTGGSGEDSGPGVSIGKYVTEDVYVGVQQDLKTGEQDVSVEVELTPNLNLESKAGTASGAGIGINWKYDY